MISTGELRKGVAIELDGELWQILDYHHIKMGRGSAQVRITLRNIKRGQTVERSFQAGTKWPRASMERRPVQFLYRDGDDFHFMDLDTYDQFHLTAAQLDDATPYLKDGMQVDRTSYQGETIGIELPVTVDLVVQESEPGFAGDTQTGARKPATTETGLIVQVPIFVEPGRHDPRRHADGGVSDPGLSSGVASTDAGSSNVEMLTRVTVRFGADERVLGCDDPRGGHRTR
jgi:elongation factor P